MGTKELQKSSEVSLQSQKSLDELTKKFDNLETEKQVQDRQLKRLLNENQELLQQIDNFDSVLKSSKEEITNLSSEKEIIEAKSQESKAEIICLKQKCQNLEFQLEEVTVNTEKSSQESKAEIICLKQKCKDLEFQLEEIKVDTEKSNIEDIQKERAETEVAKENLQEEKRKFTLEKDEMYQEKT